MPKLRMIRFGWDCHPDGKVDSVFVLDEGGWDAWQWAIRSKMALSFGSILGKHSEIFGIIEEKDYTVVCMDYDFCEKFRLEIGVVGPNPVPEVMDSYVAAKRIAGLVNG